MLGSWHLHSSTSRPKPDRRKHDPDNEQPLTDFPSPWTLILLPVQRDLPQLPEAVAAPEAPAGFNP